MLSVIQARRQDHGPLNHLLCRLGHLSQKIHNVKFDITEPPGKIGTFMDKPNIEYSFARYLL